MKKRIFLSKLFLGLSLIAVAQQNRLSLKQCIETGIANNYDVMQRQLQAERGKANWKQSRLNVLPDLNASAGHSLNQGRSIDPYTNSPVTQAFNSSNYGVSSNVILFNGFAVRNNIRQNSLSYQAASMEWQQEKDELTVNIILAYLQVLSNADQVEQARIQSLLSAKQVERLDILNKEGAIRPSEFSDLKGQYAGDRLSIIDAQNALERSKINLCSLMNVPYDKNMELEKINPEAFAEKYDANAGEIYSTAVKQLAMIKAVDLWQQSAAKGVKVAKGQFFPRLSLGAGVSTSYSSVAFQSQYLNTVYVPTSDSAIVNNVKYPVYKFHDNFTAPTKISYGDQLDNNLYTSVGLSLNIPIFNSLTQRNRVKQAKINLKNTEITAKYTRSQLSRDIEQAYLNMNSAADRYKVLLEQVNALTESFKAAEILFQQGVGNSVDYLTVKNSLDRANINLIIAKYDYVLRIKILDYYQGKQLW